jgi:hypothetical protein
MHDVGRCMHAHAAAAAVFLLLTRVDTSSITTLRKGESHRSDTRVYPVPPMIFLPTQPNRLINQFLFLKKTQPNRVQEARSGLLKVNRRSTHASPEGRRTAYQNRAGGRWFDREACLMIDHQKKLRSGRLFLEAIPWLPLAATTYCFHPKFGMYLVTVSMGVFRSHMPCSLGFGEPIRCSIPS